MNPACANAARLRAPPLFFQSRSTTYRCSPRSPRRADLQEAVVIGLRRDSGGACCHLEREQYGWAFYREACVTRILIADDHAVVRAGVKSILEGHSGWRVVAEAADGKEALSKAIETAPDVAVVDYALPVMNGAEVTRQIRARVPN